MTDPSPWYLARDQMVEAVVADLYGGPRDETLTEAPLERFIVGILHPRAADGAQEPVEVADQTPDDETGGADDGVSDPGVSFAHLRYPSTMGLTFGVTADTRAIELEVEADRYEPGPSTSEPRPAPAQARTPRPETWQRVGVGPQRHVVPLADGSPGEVPIADGLSVRVLLRPARDGVVNATVVLVNTLTKSEKGRSDASCWFRPVIRVRALDGEFADRRPVEAMAHMDADERSGELLYRHQRHLAVGHGVAVTWREEPRVTEVETTFFPQHRLHLAQADRDDVGDLSMPRLAERDPRPSLSNLVDRYEEWIDSERIKVSGLEADMTETARAHLGAASAAAARMRRGIDLLGRDHMAGEAFRAMNLVMQQQRLRQDMIRRGLDEPGSDVIGVWRPFQIAFILLNLEGLADPVSPDRDLADLLWFPTGGGKTEAYLGLIAFTLVHRRLRGAGANDDGAGVGVIMRYTLRLLTLQQFERAAGLICALEDWRMSAPGTADREPFSIGLWVGQGATPNTFEDARKALRKRQNDEDPGEAGDPVQLLRCPWCGSRLDPDDYIADKHAERIIVRCPRVQCQFSGVEGLPVHLVDSDVYRARPSLVVGTVDKFAILAWREQGGRLFGSGVDAPPDLIVQDELHLISGPLGTLVGLYETAIDALATDRDTDRRPKVVASTATIRRAADQVQAVFARESRQFPPPGIDASDSFFAVDAAADVKGTRAYVGLMAPSTSHATLLVRTYTALLQGARDLQATDEVRDAYWTLLDYFNSLRVLGAAYIQSIDDVRDRMEVVAQRKGSALRMTGDPRELTSRKRSSEIPQELDALQTPWTEPGSPDIVLATNMISVGVDVDRLGLMAVMGQPQTTSEYIQATSRVGRQHPGLVFTMYNASRSRDLSHYESFTSYHRALYKQVEATGATPFAARALDRGLHGLLVILARHLISGAASDTSVGVPVESAQLERISETIIARAQAVQSRAVPSVRAALRALIDGWSRGVENGDVQRYARWAMQSEDVKGLMVPAGSPITVQSTGETLAEIFPPNDAPWATLTSLRNVDRESTLKIISPSKKKGGE